METKIFFPTDILNEPKAVIKFTKTFDNTNQIFTGTYLNLSPRDVIEEFVNFGDNLGEFKSILIEDNRIQVSYTNAFMFLSF